MFKDQQKLFVPLVFVHQASPWDRNMMQKSDMAHRTAGAHLYASTLRVQHSSVTAPTEDDTKKGEVL